MDGGFGPRIVFEIGKGVLENPIQITETITVTWFIMAVLVILSIIFTRNLERVPSKVQNVIELIVDTINGLTKQTMGEDKMSFAPYIGTLMIFLAIGNLIGLLGLRPPTADVNTTMALAMITFTLIHVNGTRRKGIGKYLKGFTEPMILMTPINLIGEIATPISLGFRLFGNIVGGMIIMNLVYSALAGLSVKILGASAPPIFQAFIPSILHGYFDVFAGVLQSFIFAMLTMVNVSMAMD